MSDLSNILTALAAAEPAWVEVIALAADGDDQAVIELAAAVRKVRTAAGSRRYGLPIGAPIAPGMRGVPDAKAGGRGGKAGEGQGALFGGDVPKPKPRTSKTSTSSSSKGRQGKLDDGPAKVGTRLPDEAKAHVSARRRGSSTKVPRSSAGAGEYEETGGSRNLATPRDAADAAMDAPRITPQPGDKASQVARALQLAAKAQRPHRVFRDDNGGIQISMKVRPDGRKHILVRPDGTMANVGEDGAERPIPHQAVASLVGRTLDGGAADEPGPAKGRTDGAEPAQDAPNATPEGDGKGAPAQERQEAPAETPPATVDEPAEAPAETPAEKPAGKPAKKDPKADGKGDRSKPVKASPAKDPEPEPAPEPEQSAEKKEPKGAPSDNLEDLEDEELADEHERRQQASARAFREGTDEEYAAAKERVAEVRKEHRRRKAERPDMDTRTSGQKRREAIEAEVDETRRPIKAGERREQARALIERMRAQEAEDREPVTDEQLDELAAAVAPEPADGPDEDVDLFGAPVPKPAPAEPDKKPRPTVDQPELGEFGMDGVDDPFVQARTSSLFSDRDEPDAPADAPAAPETAQQPDVPEAPAADDEGEWVTAKQLEGRAARARAKARKEQRAKEAADKATREKLDRRDGDVAAQTAQGMTDAELNRFAVMVEGRPTPARRVIEDEWSRRLQADTDDLYTSPEAFAARSALHEEEEKVRRRVSLDGKQNGGKRRSDEAKQRDRDRLHAIKAERRSWNDRGRREAWLAEHPDQRTETDAPASPAPVDLDALPAPAGDVDALAVKVLSTRSNTERTRMLEALSDDEVDDLTEHLNGKHGTSPSAVRAGHRHVWNEQGKRRKARGESGGRSDATTPASRAAARDGGDRDQQPAPEAVDAPPAAAAPTPEPAPSEPRAAAPARRGGRIKMGDYDDEQDVYRSDEGRRTRADREQEADEWTREARDLGDATEEQALALIDERGWDGGQVAAFNRARAAAGLPQVGRGRETVKTKPGPAGGRLLDEVEGARAGKPRAAVLADVSDEDLAALERVELDENRRQGNGKGRKLDRKKASAYEKRERVIRDVRAEQERRIQQRAKERAEAPATAEDLERAEQGRASIRELLGNASQSDTPEVRDAADILGRVLDGEAPDALADGYDGDRATLGKVVDKLQSRLAFNDGRGLNDVPLQGGKGRTFGSALRGIADDLKNDPRGERAKLRQEQARQRAEEREKADAESRERNRPTLKLTSESQRTIADRVTDGLTRRSTWDPEESGLLAERGAYMHRDQLVITDPDRFAAELDEVALAELDEAEFGQMPGVERQAHKRRAQAAERMAEKVRALKPLEEGDVTPEARAKVRAMSDDDLEAATVRAGEDGDFVLLAAAAEEEERREKLSAKRAERDEEKARRYDELVEQGWSDEEATYEVEGLDADKEREKAAMAALQAEGYVGKSFHTLAKQSFQDKIGQVMQEAEDATNGYLWNPEGRRLNLPDSWLFTGDKRDALKYASEELADWWAYNGRLTLTEWKAMLRGDAVGARASRANDEFATMQRP